MVFLYVHGRERKSPVGLRRGFVVSYTKVFCRNGKSLAVRRAEGRDGVVAPFRQNFVEAVPSAVRTDDVPTLAGNYRMSASSSGTAKGSPHLSP